MSAPSRAELRHMADGEDAAGCVSVGGMAADLGHPVHAESQERDMLRAEIARLNLVIDEMASSLSKQTLKPAITERRMAEKTVNTRGWKSSLVQVVALWELVKDQDDEEAGPGDLYWEGSHTGLDREWRLDDLAFKPEHFKPGAVVIVMEPSQ